MPIATPVFNWKINWIYRGVVHSQKRCTEFKSSNKIQGFFLDFSKFFWVYEDFINKKGFRHWIRGVVHSQIRYTDLKSSKTILGYFGFFGGCTRIFLSEKPLELSTEPTNTDLTWAVTFICRVIRPFDRCKFVHWQFVQMSSTSPSTMSDLFICLFHQDWATRNTKPNPWRGVWRARRSRGSSSSISTCLKTNLIFWKFSSATKSHGDVKISSASKSPPAPDIPKTLWRPKQFPRTSWSIDASAFCKLNFWSVNWRMLCRFFLQGPSWTWPILKASWHIHWRATSKMALSDPFRY